ncbi:toxin-antitoxin system HicB family antitoxin [Ralstonia pickettii]|uniref:Toxin-antitoxin system HicB family antitoxin n=1 Tax=Ralstonia pickettii TaxID=329 RepID=A0A7X2HN02_RALPI|nr:type II toxin-antitoxin system HicB family antitoxin [Ralstonia pickettii]MRS99451.1 toxin-antitoxin system HicB family antitoxin [Ralstonia pickettii]
MEKATLQYRNYVGTSEISYEDNVLYGKILFINDLITYEGDSPAELKLAFESAVEEYERRCIEHGVPAEKPCSGTFNVRVPPEIHRAANLKAARLGVPLNELVKLALSNFLDEKKVEVHHHSHNHFAEAPVATIEYEVSSGVYYETSENSWQPSQKNGTLQ